MKTDNRITEVPQNERLALRKSWQAPVVEVLMVSETQNHAAAGGDLTAHS